MVQAVSGLNWNVFLNEVFSEMYGVLSCLEIKHVMWIWVVWDPSLIAGMMRQSTMSCNANVLPFHNEAWFIITKVGILWWNFIFNLFTRNIHLQRSKCLVACFDRYQWLTWYRFLWKFDLTSLLRFHLRFAQRTRVFSTLLVRYASFHRAYKIFRIPLLPRWWSQYFQAK